MSDSEYSCCTMLDEDQYSVSSGISINIDLTEREPSASESWIDESDFGSEAQCEATAVTEAYDNSETGSVDFNFIESEYTDNNESDSVLEFYCGLVSESMLYTGIRTENEIMACNKWTTFNDEDYVNGAIDVTVTEASLFTYTKLSTDTVPLSCMPRKPKVIDLVQDMVKNNYSATTIIQIRDRSFNCISTLLRCYSPWFANIHWRQEHIVLDEIDVSAAAFEVIYKWMRLQVPVEFPDAVKVLQAAKFLKIDLLESDCWHLISQNDICEKMAFKIYLEAYEMPLLEGLANLMLNRVRGYFLALVYTNDFKNLKINQLMKILNRDLIGVNCEVEVFFAVMHWMSHDPDHRLMHMRKLMTCVRFPYIPMGILFNIRNALNSSDAFNIWHEDRVLEEFRKDSEMSTLLCSVMTYIGIHFDKDNKTDNCDPSIKLVYPRRWIYHPKCPYHLSNLTHPYEHEVTHTMFLDYIESIQEDWSGDMPPKDAVLDVEFDGILELSPALEKYKMDHANLDDSTSAYSLDD